MRKKKFPIEQQESSLLKSKQRHQDMIISCFGALCFFLSTLEYLIPKPLPFLRLGLANLPIMLAIEVLPLHSFFILVLIKLLGQALLGGTLFSYIFIFAFASTLISATSMFIAKKVWKNSISFIGISIIGALGSNVIQLLLARLFIFGEGTWFIAMPMVALGTVTGTLLGIFANRFANRSRWYALAKESSNFCMPLEEKRTPATKKEKKLLFIRLAMGTILISFLFFSPTLHIKLIIFVLIILLILIDKIHINLGSLLIVSASIIIFNLLIPYGKVIFEVWNITITEGALVSGIKKALVLEGMILLSKWMLKPQYFLPGRFGSLVSNSFTTMNYLISNKGTFNPKNFIERIDALMCERVKDRQEPRDNQDAT